MQGHTYYKLVFWKYKNLAVDRLFTIKLSTNIRFDCIFFSFDKKWEQGQFVIEPIFSILFCFFLWHICRKQLRPLIWVFPKLPKWTKGNRGKVFRSRGRIFEAEAAGRGREMNRPRLRNVPRGSLLSTEVTWEIQIRGQNCFIQTCSRNNDRAECFFHFFGFFVEFWLLLELIQ